jgi:aspartyl-tRNA synthetase
LWRAPEGRGFSLPQSAPQHFQQFILMASVGWG